MITLLKVDIKHNIYIRYYSKLHSFARGSSLVAYLIIKKWKLATVFRSVKYWSLQAFILSSLYKIIFNKRLTWHNESGAPDKYLFLIF